MADATVARHVRLDGVIATVDAVAGQATLDRHSEALRQAAVADRILLTKTDLASDEAARDLEQRLRTLNPAAPITRTAQGEVDPALLFDIGFYDPATKSLDVRRWLKEESYAAAHAHSLA